MSYENWRDVQVIRHGQVVKPIHYKIAQYAAMNSLIGHRIQEDQSALDVGCGEGAGALFLHCFGFTKVRALDVNPEKIKVARALGIDAVPCSVESEDFLSYFPEDEKFDVIWCSHMLEHAYSPETVMRRIRDRMKRSSILYLILPYPDTGDRLAHCASNELGLRDDDNGKTLLRWLRDQGFFTTTPWFSSFREPEIWVTAGRDDRNG